MTKLTISHALAQSVKLAFFEGVVEQTIVKTKDIPFNLANNGTISMSRKSITKQIGELFVMRINVNLVSNVLDTPEIFWAEPTLCPLYKAVRTYLEISQRVDVLNQRCSVLNDLIGYAEGTFQSCPRRSLGMDRHNTHFIGNIYWHLYHLH